MNRSLSELTIANKCVVHGHEKPSTFINFEVEAETFSKNYWKVDKTQNFEIN